MASPAAPIRFRLSPPKPRGCDQAAVSSVHGRNFPCSALFFATPSRVEGRQRPVARGSNARGVRRGFFVALLLALIAGENAYPLRRARFANLLLRTRLTWTRFRFVFGHHIRNAVSQFLSACEMLAQQGVGSKTGLGMTSEIAVLNQKAVALAADSAVTLVDGGLVAVRNDTRKLFNLIEGRPIGLMFFGVADVMGHPWDLLIEHYQTKVKPQHFAHVADYAASFLSSLDNLEEFFPRARQKDEYRRLLASVFRYIFHFAQYLRDSGENEQAQVSDAAVLDAAIERVWRTYQTREDGSPRPDLPCFPKDFAKKVAADYGPVIEETIAYGFQPFNLNKQATQRLHDIAIWCVVKDLFLEDVTGLVFSGYGAEDRYPVVVTCYMSAIVGGIVKRGGPTIDAIDGDIRSRIRVFADSEVTNAFIRGIDFNLERRLYGGFRVMLHGLVDQLVDALPDANTRENVRGRFQKDFVPRYFDAFHKMIADYQQQAFINPILRVLEIAAKNELAETARDLVGLNVFKKRITAQKQTVGGAIDVAIISRENGFQWWSRQGGG